MCDLQELFDSEASLYASKVDVLEIRRTNGDDRVVAALEIVSPGQKTSQDTLKRLAERTAETLREGINLILIDVLSPRDSKRVHPIIWRHLGETFPADPPGEPLTVVSYTGGPTPHAYLDTVAVGDRLPNMPLFLTPDEYVNVPLEETYMQAYETMPDDIMDILEETRP
jgi:hypothetical protein